MAQLLEVLQFRSWVESAIPIEERSHNAKGIYEKVLATFLTVLAGGERFSHLSWWSHGIEAIRKALLYSGSPEPQAPSPVFGVKSTPSCYLKNWPHGPENWHVPS
jgi:hypothetical protein